MAWVGEPAQWCRRDVLGMGGAEPHEVVDLHVSTTPQRVRRNIMNRFRTTAVAVVSTVALGSFAAATVPTAFAGGKPAPCSLEQAHVDKATAKLDTLAAVFAA